VALVRPGVEEGNKMKDKCHYIPINMRRMDEDENFILAMDGGRVATIKF